MIHRSTCRLCDSKALELALDIKPSPVGDAFIPASRLHEEQPLYPLTTYICRACGHLQNIDLVEPTVLFRDYTYRTSVSLGLVEHFRQYAKAIVEKHSIAPGSLVAEIGSNDGSLLAAFKELGMQTLGIDPAVAIANEATARGIPTIPEFFSAKLSRDITDRQGKASVFCANNVFAHIDDLNDVVDGVRNMLAPDGIFVFEVSYVRDMVENLAFDTVYHEHVSHHALTPLDTFLRRHGMQLFDAEKIATKGGSIRGFAQLTTGTRSVSQQLRALMWQEQELGLLTPAPYRKLFAEIEARKREIHANIEAIIKKGGTIATYGASTTTTTLLYHFQLERSVTTIFDDNPIKHGMFSPGAHIPVLPSGELYNQQPDLIIILAWLYTDPILARHTRYIDQGGIFLVPLPNLRVHSRSAQASAQSAR